MLNKARAIVPTSHEIWFAAAQLEEQQGHNERVYKIIHRAVLTLAKKGIAFDREHRLNEAIEMEERGYLEVCRSIIRAVANVDLEEENKADVWISEAERQQEKGHIECSRALFALALTEYPSDPDIWMSAAILEQNSDTLKTLIELLE
ncbi:Pre-mRNA-processing factor 6 [Mycoemilia scoparia]|uniref:Pre-mRNA-processing factor 6 n=1 Tax=Mycoemilia scoparia TaxID=417184 RepID=A0A9W8A981_9FUNG|nr:Pre-mRNA-processing factor 6 [Mycoemilia scoparia]